MAKQKAALMTNGLVYSRAAVLTVQMVILGCGKAFQLFGSYAAVTLNVIKR